MVLKVADRIKQTTTTSGTGDISFTGTPTGFATFGSVLTNGDTTYYAIEENDKWEVGIGTYGSDNMVRSYVLASSNSGNAINLGGSGVVFISYPADKSVYRDAQSQLIAGASGVLFPNGTIVKDAKLPELTDVASSGAFASTHVLSFNNTNKSLLLGDSTGPSNSNNSLIGYGAASGTTGTDNVVVGTNAFVAGGGGIQNVGVGTFAGPSEGGFSSSASYCVSVGHKAGSRMRSDSTAIGHQAGIASYEFGFVAVGSAAGSGIGGYSVAVGYQAGNAMASDYVVSVGHQAGKSAAGDSSVWIGSMAGLSATSASKSIGIGHQAGKSSSSNDSIYIGQSAGQSNSSNDYLYIGNGSPSSSRTLIKGDMQSKRLAVGVADVTLSDTLYVGVASSVDTGLVVRGAASQSANLTEWQDSAGTSLAHMASSGILVANGVQASGQGFVLQSALPNSTSDNLYNVGGTLYWNLSPIGVPTGVPNKVAFYDELGRLTSETDFTYSSGDVSLTVGNTTIESDLISINDGGGRIRVGRYVGDTGITESNYSLMLGYSAGLNASGSNNSAIVGYYAGFGTLDTNNSQIIGNLAGLYSSGERNTYIGDSVGAYSSGTYNTFIGNNAGKYCVGSQNIEILASGAANSVIDGYSNKVNIGNTIIGDTSNKKLAVGNVGTSNVTPDATLEILPKNSTDIGVIVQGAASQSANLQEWQASNAVSVAELSADGSIATSGTISASGGVLLTPLVPSVTTNKLYNDSGTLKFSGSAIGGGGSGYDDTYVSGVAVYSSGQAIENEGLVTYASGQAIANQTATATNTSNVSTNTGNISTNTGRVAYASGQAIENETGLVYASGSATYASGQAIENEGLVTYASGQAIANQTATATNTSNVSTNTSNISTNTGRVNYASGQAVQNEIDLAYTSGVATYASGNTIVNDGLIAYASGNTANINFGSNAEGDILYHNGTSFIRLAKGTNNYVLTMDGNVPNWEASAGGGGISQSDFDYASGVANYASGQAIENESDLVYASGSAAYASGQAIENEGLATYASGLAITNELNVAYASGQAIENEGLVTYASGQAIANQTATATNTSNISTNTSNISTNSGRVTYASGQAIQNEIDTAYTSGIATYASGNTIVNDGLVTYASGQAIANQTATATNTSNVSTNTGNISTNTGRVNYASGQAVQNEIDLAYTSGIATYASGNTIVNDGLIVYASGNTANIAFGSDVEGDILYHDGTSFTRLAKGTNNYILTMNGNVPNWEASAGGGGISQSDFDYASGVANYASGQAIENETGLVYASGSAAYASGNTIVNDGLIAYASGNTANIAFGSNAEGDILYHNGSTFVRLAKGTDNHILKMAGNVPNWEAETSDDDTYVSGVAVYSSGQAIENEGLVTYASGQAIANQTATATNTSNVSTNTGNISTNTGRVAYASGQAIENETGLVYASGSAAYASGQAIENEGLVTYASGQAIENETGLVYASGSAAYASGQAIENEGLVTYASGNTANITFGSNAEGDILYHNGTTFVRLAKGTDNHVLTMNGNVPNWELSAGDITGVTAGNGLSGGGSSGAVTLDIEAAQTVITSIYATDLIIGEDAQTAIDFGTVNEIDFKVDNANRLTLTSSSLHPETDNQIDLGTNSLEFKDAYFDGTVTSDAFAGPLTGNADTATALATTRAIAVAGDVTGTANFDGSAAISITTTLATDAIVTANITDDAVTYAKVQDVSATSRVLGRITSGAGVIEELTGANIVTMIGTLNQNTTGSAATLTTPRAINGVNFDGSAPITVTAAGSTLSDTVTVAKGGTGQTSYTNGQLLIGNTTGNTLSKQVLSGDATMTNAGVVTVATLNQNTTGSAATLTTARAIAVAGDVTGTANFDGSAAISITTTLATDAIVTANITDVNVTTGKIANDAVTYAKVQDVSATSRVLGRITSGAGVIEELTGANIATIIGTLNQDTTGTAAIATTVTVADESSDAECFPLFVTAATGNLGAKSGTNLTFNSNTGVLTATGFAGPLTGNVTGNASGTAATVTGGTQASITTVANVTTVGALGAGSITSGFGNIDNGSSSIACGSLDVSDGNITNVGSIACDSIIVDVATAGLDIVFGGNTTLNKMTLTDNLADALNVTEGSNSYMKFVTTNSGESIVTSKNLVQHPDMTNTALTSQSGSVVINANLGNYFTVATTGAITGLDIQNAVVGQKIVIRFAWGGTHSIAYTDTVIWPGGTAATVTASGVDTLGFICTTASSAFDAFIIGLDIKAA